MRKIKCIEKKYITKLPMLHAKYIYRQNEGETAIDNWCVNKCDRVKECENHANHCMMATTIDRRKKKTISYDCATTSEKSH